MNTQTELSKQMHDQVDRIDGSPISLDDVVGTAGRIRRRRRLATGTAVLAAAAVIVPTGLFAGGAFDDESVPDPAAPTPTLVHEAVLDPDAQAGEPPTIPYIDADGIELPDGDSIPLSTQYSSIVRAGDEYLATRGEPGGEPYIDVLDADGTVVDSYRVEKGPGGSTDHSMGAWVSQNGTVYVRTGGETLELESIPGELPSVMAVDGDPSCGTESDVCRVLTQPQDGPPMMVNSHGTTDLIFGDFTLLADVSSDGLLAGRTTEWNGDPAQERCNTVVDEDAHEQLFETCDVAFEGQAGFSPSNDLIVGSTEDQLGSVKTLVILDARTGDTRMTVRLSEKNHQIVGSHWEGDNHLLVRVEGASMTGPVANYLYRVSLEDGSVELVFGSQGSGSEYAPWGFVG